MAVQPRFAGIEFPLRPMIAVTAERKLILKMAAHNYDLEPDCYYVDRSPRRERSTP
jgi:hypothetical protein